MHSPKHILASLALLLITQPAVAVTEYKLGHVGTPTSLYQDVALHFAKLVEQKSQGQIKIAVFPGSQLGNDREMLQKLKLGTLDFALPSTVMSSESELFGVFEMPYLVKDRKHLARIEKDVFWPKIAPTVEKKGLKVVSLWENGYRHITNNQKPILKPDDLSGIKLRIPRGKWRAKMFQSYGASPSPMAFSEVFTALQTGVMDGQENPLIQIYSAKLHEVQKYLSLSGHVYAPMYLTAGLRRWDGLPADTRKLLQEAAKEAQAYCYVRAQQLDDDLLAKLKSGGIRVNEVDKTAFVKASMAIYEEFGKEVPGGKEAVDAALRLAQ